MIVVITAQWYEPCGCGGCAVEQCNRASCLSLLLDLKRRLGLLVMTEFFLFRGKGIKTLEIK